MSRTVIICKSVHHGNTLQVARAIAEVLHAEIVAPEEFPYTSLGDADFARRLPSVPARAPARRFAG